MRWSENHPCHLIASGALDPKSGFPPEPKNPPALSSTVAVCALRVATSARAGLRGQGCAGRWSRSPNLLPPPLPSSDPPLRAQRHSPSDHARLGWPEHVAGLFVCGPLGRRDPSLRERPDASTQPQPGLRPRPRFAPCGRCPLLPVSPPTRLCLAAATPPLPPESAWRIFTFSTLCSPWCQ